MRYLDLPPVWLAAHMALAWGMAEVWAPLGTALLWPGRALIVAALLVMVWAAVTMRRHRTTLMPGAAPDALVTGGPFRWSRNPIYLADLVILAGWCLSLGTVAGLLLLIPLHRVLTRRFVEPEERRLAAAFPEAFRTFATSTRRWV